MVPAAKLKTQSCLVEFSVTAPPGMTQAFITKALANIEFSTKVSKWLTVSEAAQLKKVRQASVSNVSKMGVTHVALTGSWDIPEDPGANVEISVLVYNKMFELQTVVDPSTRGNYLIKHYSTHEYTDRNQRKSAHELLSIDVDAMPYESYFLFFVISSSRGLQDLVHPNGRSSQLALLLFTTPPPLPSSSPS